MNYLKKYADQVQSISLAMKSGEITMEQGAVKLQAVAVLAEQDAAAMDDVDYAADLNRMVDMIYNVIEKMKPERRVRQ
ncbi:hypothetical protein [Maridesulfovibrio hydrothermalis]|uniref:Uncharacterized protein n=1 Tax=Maridesulfovibrio hydrothermalis AM13 = DSM 14728 TaxID=1121451 RepID=L0REQ1_9BACT|nr:hypothetical protein [Maridesulfovibrio hydrothermalis]CCO24687.1 conserved protein of unknown function [Maridesulfovibrio hydrothermalis AM13 = DSM 14728]